jgi:hypothetical protein
MKSFSIISGVILVSLTVLFYSCKKSSELPATTKCSVIGNGYDQMSSQNYGYGAIASTLEITDTLYFDDTNKNFSCAGGYMIDEGLQVCLDFSDTVNTSAKLATFVNGHGYEAKFPDGHIYKFIAWGFNDGDVYINLVFQ